MNSIFSYPRHCQGTDELQLYLSESVELQDSDVLLYWKYKSRQWPCLSRMAKDFMAITATNTSSERVFTCGRNLLDVRRYALLPENMEAVICLRSWLNSDSVKSTTSPRDFDSMFSEVVDLNNKETDGEKTQEELVSRDIDFYEDDDSELD